MVGSAKSPFWNDTYELLVNRSPIRYRLGQALRRGGVRTLREQVRAGLAASATESVSSSSYQIEAVREQDQHRLGGKRNITTVNDMGSDTTVSQAQETENLNTLTTFRRGPSPYPRDASGNGGPAYTP